MSIGFLFPGQGSQTPGTLHELPQHPAITGTLDEISEVLASDVLQLDSADALQSTISVQLALLASGVAVARALEEDGIVAEAVAGLSVGAFGAAVHCGVISLADSVRLVRQRAEGMLALYPESYSLAAIVGLTEQQVSKLIAAAHTDIAPVYLANINAPRQIVIAGSEDGMQSVLEAARQSGATRAERLPDLGTLTLSVAGASCPSPKANVANHRPASSPHDICGQYSGKSVANAERHRRGPGEQHRACRPLA